MEEDFYFLNAADTFEEELPVSINDNSRKFFRMIDFGGLQEVPEHNVSSH